MHTYHVTYHWTRKRRGGVGSCTLTRPGPIATSEDVEAVRLTVLAKSAPRGSAEVVVLGWQPLADEADETAPPLPR